ncbi:hypothetical protein CEP52_009681 [Fusarium oligoseptatum]|uniref:Uncharacterized protein n=1 Tax=Fusarium oligoseptatum TaxID=2604345 RepID=A0A428TBZ9_9HYPO|nr:hypothetical protein CEP52_009681 [Fusarium oligoseptatum]
MSFYAELMSYKSVGVDDMDDCRSECSYYSLPELNETDPVRRIPASVVKQQAEAVPASGQMKTSYPHAYNNSERLPLRVAGPWLEHPLMKDGPYSSGSPGPARVIVSAMGGKGYDVIYHPVRRVYWGHKKNTFAQARYHPKGSRCSNMPAQNQYVGQPPWGLASPSTLQPLSHTELFQTHVGADLSQCLAMQQQLIAAQQIIATQQLIVAEQLIVAQQINATQQYLDSLQHLYQPSPYYWNDYSNQMMASAP